MGASIKPLQLSSPSPASIEGCRRPCPHTFKGYYSYFYHHFLKSHFSGCSVCAEKHHSPGRNLPQGTCFHSQPLRRAKGGSASHAYLAQGEGPCCEVEKGKISSTPKSRGKQLHAVEASVKPCQCQSWLHAGPRGDIREPGDGAFTSAGLQATVDVICL